MTLTHDLSPTNALTLVLDLATASFVVGYAGGKNVAATELFRSTSRWSFANDFVHALQKQVGRSDGCIPLKDARFDDLHQNGGAITFREDCLTIEAKRDAGKTLSVSAITLADQCSQKKDQDGAK